MARTVHLIGMPHTELTSEYSWCAYSSKVLKLATMLHDAGERVIEYSGEVSDARSTEHVTVVRRPEQQRWFGHYNWAKDTFGDFDSSKESWQTMAVRTADAIRQRAQPGDILGLSMGWTQKPIADMLSDLNMLVVETGIGYSGVWAPYRVYESWAWRHYTATREPSDDVRWYDTVIPNFFEREAFPAGKGDGGYYLYIGRLIQRKGPHIAAEACKRIGAKLIVAGQGAEKVEAGRITATDGTVIEGDVEYVGVVGPEQRAILMGGAIASFVPTIYLEPFGGVSVEAQMTGTPAIVSNWGGLTENVIDGFSGFRCTTLREFVEAAQAAGSLDREAIRTHAQATWSTDVLVGDYQRYFDRLATLYGDGWYSA